LWSNYAARHAAEQRSSRNDTRLPVRLSPIRHTKGGLEKN
jgi:hypothetical protein